MILAQSRFEPPVTPNGPTAQAWILKELAKPEYRASQPTWFDRAATAVRDWFNSLGAGAAPSIPGLGPIVVVVVVAVVLLIAFLVFGLPRLNRRSAIGAARATVRDDGGCLSRAAPQRFTADGPLARAQANNHCAFRPQADILLRSHGLFSLAKGSLG